MRLLVLALIAFTAACASTGQTGNRGSSDLITRAELEASNQSNAFYAVRSLRPQWLRVRGPNSFNSQNPIQVYVDGVRYGTVEDLSALPILAIEQIRFYDAPEAQARWGLNNTNGAIAVTMRRN